MGNHVIYDRLWESRKLAQCSRDAAMAYPWIFLIADDHGRFEYHPYRVWTKVFGSRQDVTLQEVTRWMDEYWRVGLLVRYHMDGELAYWYKFKGRRPSERKPSDLADPTGIPTLEWTPPKPVENRVPQTNTPAPEVDQIRSDQSRSELAPPASARIEASLIPPLSWSNEAASDWIDRHGGKPPGAMFKALGRLVKASPWSMVRPALRHYLATRELDYLNWQKFESGFLTIHAEATGAPARASPAAQARVSQVVAGAKGGLLDERGVVEGLDAHGGQPERSGHDAADGGGARKGLPRSLEPPGGR